MLHNQRKALMTHPVVEAYRHFKWYVMHTSRSYNDYDSLSYKGYTLFLDISGLEYLSENSNLQIN